MFCFVWTIAHHLIFMSLIMPLRHIPAEGWGEKASPGRMQQKEKPLGCAGVQLILSRHVFSITYLQLLHFPVEKQICGPVARKLLPPSAHCAQVWEGADLNPLSSLTSAGFFVNKLFCLGTQSHHQTLELLRKDGDDVPPVLHGSQCWQVHKNSTFLIPENVLGFKTLKMFNSDLRMNWSSHLPKRPSHN